MYLAKEPPQHSKEAKKTLFAASDLYSKSMIVMQSSPGCWLKKKDPAEKKNSLKKLNATEKDTETTRLKSVASSKNASNDSTIRDIGSDAI